MPEPMQTATRNEAACTWSTQVFPRDGAPPLRVACLCLNEVSAPLSAGDDLFIGLWERKTGGFVVTHSVLGAEAPGATAASVADLDEAATLIEEYCQGLQEGHWSLPRKIDAPGVSLISAITDLGRQAEAVRTFLVLAGKALDGWQGMGPAGATRTKER